MLSQRRVISFLFLVIVHKTEGEKVIHHPTIAVHGRRVITGWEIYLERDRMDAK
jgi:hypothetical protein